MQWDRGRTGGLGFLTGSVLLLLLLLLLSFEDWSVIRSFNRGRLWFPSGHVCR